MVETLTLQTASSDREVDEGHTRAEIWGKLHLGRGGREVRRERVTERECESNGGRERECESNGGRERE